jgi:predicted enzyme related to lactoylglutathione lyase
VATIVHFDISAENVEGAKKFYHEMFDWKFISMPEPMSYTLIETKDLKGENSIGGGMAKRENPEQARMINFIGVISFDESIKKVIELGGKIT